MNLGGMFPRASRSFLEANRNLDIKTAENKQNAVAGLAAPSKTAKSGKRGQMNKTEREFSMIVEAMKSRGEILRWEFEGLTLRWRDRETGELIRYTPDFVVFHLAYIKLIEVKGAFIKGKFERAIERFRHARTYWPEFQFEMHQRKAGQWSRIR